AGGRLPRAHAGLRHPQRHSRIASRSDNDARGIAGSHGDGAIGQPRDLGSWRGRGPRPRQYLFHRETDRRMSSAKTIVVIGNGMVGQRFLEQLTSRISSDSVDVTVFCEEPRAAYDRVQLTSFFAGKSAFDLSVVPERFFEEKAITLRLNDPVISIDRS